MNTWLIVFQKELKNILKHFQTHRRWLVSLSVPFLLFWVLFTFTGRFIDQQLKASSEQKYKIAFIHHNNAQELQEKLKNNLTLEIKEGIAEDSLAAWVEKDSIQAALVLPKDFDALLVQRKTADVRLIQKTSNLGGVAGELREALKYYEQDLVRKNLDSLNLSSGIANPIELNLESTEGIGAQMEMAGKLLQLAVSNLLALFIILFSLWASKHTAIYLFTHEVSERTLERLLSATPNRFGIWLGKVFALGKVACVAAWLALLGFYLSTKMPYADMGKALVEIMVSTLSSGKLLKITLLAIPTSLFLSLCWTLFATATRTPYQATQLGFFFYILITVLTAVFINLQLSNSGILLYLPIANTVALIQNVINETVSIADYIVFLGVYLVGMAALAWCSFRLFLRGVNK